MSAADNWGDSVKRKTVKPSMLNSYEHTLHEAYIPHYALDLRNDLELHKFLEQPRLERAIGVIYRPETER